MKHGIGELFSIEHFREAAQNIILTFKLSFKTLALLRKVVIINNVTKCYYIIKWSSKMAKVGRKSIPYQEIARACTELEAQNETISVRKVVDLTGGSFSTV